MTEQRIARELAAIGMALDAAETFKCPNCDTKVLKQTEYCVKCQKKVKASRSLTAGYVQVKNDPDDGKTFEVLTSVHDDPRLGGQVIKSGLSERQALKLGRQLSERWGDELLRFEVSGEWPRLKYKKVRASRRAAVNPDKVIENEFKRARVDTKRIDVTGYDEGTAGQLLIDFRVLLPDEYRKAEVVRMFRKAFREAVTVDKVIGDMDGTWVVGTYYEEP